MQLTIETPNLGPVSISQRVIRYFKLSNDDPDKANDEAVHILQSSEIERLDVPAIIASRMTSNGAYPDALEFWVHPDSSTVFLVIPKDNYRQVDGAIKQSMDGFVFGDS